MEIPAAIGGEGQPSTVDSVQKRDFPTHDESESLFLVGFHTQSIREPFVLSHVVFNTDIFLYINIYICVYIYITFIILKHNHPQLYTNQTDQCPSIARGQVLESNSGELKNIPSQNKLYLTYPQQKGAKIQKPNHRLLKGSKQI